MGQVSAESGMARHVVTILGAEIGQLRCQKADMLAALKAIQQRLNESGTGEMGLLDTIYAAHALAVAAIAKAA